MGLTYERQKAQRSEWEAWGALAYGTTRIPMRLLVLVAGIFLWFVAMLLVGGAEAITAIWTNMLFVVPLVLVGSVVRTVHVRAIAVMVFAGGALMGVMYVLAQLFAPLLQEGATRAVLVPFVEELLKVLPVLGFVWLGRRTYAWSVGATDLLLLGAASGVGFGVVEDAYIRAHSGWPDQIDWLPVTEIIGGRLIVGHGIWTALAAATIGLALLLRTRRPLLVPLALAASGFVVSVIDHAANNYSVGRSDAVGDLMNLVSQNGWTALWLFFVVAVSCLAADALIVHRRLRGVRRYQLPPRIGGVHAWRSTWEFILHRRALAFAWYRAEHAPRRLFAEVGSVVARLEWSLFMRQPAHARSAIAAALVRPPAVAGTSRPTEERPTTESSETLASREEG